MDLLRLGFLGPLNEASGAFSMLFERFNKAGGWSYRLLHDHFVKRYNAIMVWKIGLLRSFIRNVRRADTSRRFSRSKDIQDNLSIGLTFGISQGDNRVLFKFVRFIGEVGVVHLAIWCQVVISTAYAMLAYLNKFGLPVHLVIASFL
jgi:hypothetical protein